MLVAGRKHAAPAAPNERLFLGSDSSGYGSRIIFKTVSFLRLQLFVFAALPGYFTISSDGKPVPGLDS